VAPRVSSVENPRRVGIAELEQRLGRDRVTIWRWYRAGKFPAPHYLGERRCWFAHELEAWEAAEMARPAEARRCSRNLTASPAAQP
jgi:predicted DNA-binding transcriptional regulator AlpA